MATSSRTTDLTCWNDQGFRRQQINGHQKRSIQQLRRRIKVNQDDIGNNFRSDQFSLLLPSFPAFVWLVVILLHFISLGPLGVLRTVPAFRMLRFSSCRNTVPDASESYTYWEQGTNALHFFWLQICHLWDLGEILVTQLLSNQAKSFERGDGLHRISMEVADKVLDGHVVKTDCQNCKCQIDTTRLDNVKSGSLVDIRPLIKLRLIPN